MKKNITRFIDNKVKTVVINIGTEEEPYELKVKVNQPRSFLNAVIDAVLAYCNEKFDNDTFLSSDYIDTIVVSAIFEQFTDANIKSIDDVGYILDQTDIFDKVIAEIGREQYDYILEGVITGRRHYLKTKEFEINIEKMFKPIADKIGDLLGWANKIDVNDLIDTFKKLDSPEIIKGAAIQKLIENMDK